MEPLVFFGIGAIFRLTNNYESQPRQVKLTLYGTINVKEAAKDRAWNGISFFLSSCLSVLCR